MQLFISLRRFVLLLLMTLSVVGVNAQHKKARPPFDPNRFQVDLEQYITSHAGLTPKEAADFFPVYRQMMAKQRMLFDEMNRLRFIDISDEAVCVETVRQQDNLDIRMRQLQQEYHSRFMTILKPSKVVKVIRAEEQFHRQAFKKMKK